MTDPTELRRLAEAATPGPWMVSGGSVVSSRANIADCSWAWDRVADQPHMVADDLRYIAAMHPQTTLALLDRLARAETLVAQCKATLEAMHPATGMPDEDVARLYNAMMEALGDER